jgi:hypothetical protein
MFRDGNSGISYLEKIKNRDPCLFVDKHRNKNLPDLFQRLAVSSGVDLSGTLGGGGSKFLSPSLPPLSPFFPSLSFSPSLLPLPFLPPYPYPFPSPPICCLPLFPPFPPVREGGPGILPRKILKLCIAVGEF